MSKVYFEKMQNSDLDQVLLLEQQNYEVPWSKKTMKDCIRAGYHCLLMKSEDKIIGYAFLMTGFEESHLLNMCISKYVLLCATGDPMTQNRHYSDHPSHYVSP